MLPPYDRTRPQSTGPVDWFKQLDWFEGFSAFDYALRRPIKLANQTSQRYNMLKQLRRPQPTLSLLLIAMVTLVCPLYWLAFSPRHPQVSFIVNFCCYPLLWLTGLALVFSSSFYLVSTNLPPAVEAAIEPYATKLYDMTQVIKFRITQKSPSRSAQIPVDFRDKVLRERDRFVNRDIFFHYIDVFVYCAIPYLFIVGPVQYLLLPFLLPPPIRHRTALTIAMKFLMCFFANCLHFSAITVWCHSLASNLSVLPPPVKSFAGIACGYVIFAAGSIMFLTGVQVNLTELFYRFAFQL